MKQKRYIIKADILKFLLENSYVLEALQSGGVDNWDYYDEALDEYLANYGLDNFNDLVTLKLEEFKSLMEEEDAI